MSEEQVWELDTGGRTHRVEVSGSIRRHLVWSVDGEVVAEETSSDDKVRLVPESAAEHGVVQVRHSALGKPRRATWWDPADGDPRTRSLTGTGGVDLIPAPGSPAAAWEERLRRHPRRHALLSGLAATAGIVVPLLLGLLAVRFAVSLPWPDLPDIPWPDLPRIPWPDLPSIPWPDWSLPDWEAPGWVRAVVDVAQYVVPVLFAVAIASGEVRRRRRQDELRRELEGRAAAERTSWDESEADGTDRD